MIDLHLYCVLRCVITLCSCCCYPLPLPALRRPEDAQPYSALFDVLKLQEFMRTHVHKGDKASGGHRTVRVVDSAPAWMQGQQYWAPAKLMPFRVGSRCAAIANHPFRHELGDVFPQAMLVQAAIPVACMYCTVQYYTVLESRSLHCRVACQNASRHGRMLEMTCMMVCYGYRHEDSLEFSIVDATW